MSLKRITKGGLVMRRLSPNAKPLPGTGPRRLAPSRPRLPPDHDALVNTLLAEIATGNSLMRLYASLLAHEILTHNPKLARKYRRSLEALQE
jgi:hypothetical protein